MEPIANVTDAEAWTTARRAAYESRGELPLPPDLEPRLERLRDRHRGQRIFIIGNGPSLNRTDLRLLSGEYTFAVNKFYLLYDRIDWTPTFYTALDWRVVPDIFREINGLTGSIKFLDYRYYGLLADSNDAIWYSHAGVGDAQIRTQGFSPDATNGLVGAGSVVGSAIQLAFFMGFDPIYLIGCDLGYRVPSSVVQEGPDQFGNGVGIYLTSTADDDANHFSNRYFGAGSKWHDPNVKRMIQGHEACYAFVKSQGRSILNATVGGELEVYPRAGYATLFVNKGDVGSRGGQLASEHHEVGPYDRSSHLQIDESDLVRSACAGLTLEEPRTMIDVGAHFGTASIPFYRDGWDVDAFEPDPENRRHLERSLARSAPRMAPNGREPRFVVNPSAVSHTTNGSAPLFRSATSSGISGLHRFVDDHQYVEHVPTVRLDDYMESRGIGTCTFLKIDVEGHDLFALDSFPFSRVQPSFVLVEFDDGKTIPLGYSVGTLANKLLDEGYIVFVSEWHPIVRYGDIHAWKGLFPWGSRSIDPKGWGNLLGIERRAWAHVRPRLTTAIAGSMAASTERAARRKNDRPQGSPRRPAAVPEANPPPQPTSTRREPAAHHDLRRITRGVSGWVSSNATAALERRPRIARIAYSTVRKSERLRALGRRLYRAAPAPTKAAIDRIITETGLYD